MTTLHPKDNRGTTKLAWLAAKHSFSFGNYQDPRYVSYGALRVLNHDVIAPSGGFPMHPHANAEIITIPLRGEISHKDNTGNERTIGPDEVQVMSAGSGIQHSEFNPSDTNETELLQIWLLPSQKDVSPRYEDRALDPVVRKTGWSVIASGTTDAGIPIQADATVSRATLSSGTERQSALNAKAYLYVISGSGNANGLSITAGDGVMLDEEGRLIVTANTTLDLILFQL